MDLNQLWNPATLLLMLQEQLLEQAGPILSHTLDRLRAMCRDNHPCMRPENRKRFLVSVLLWMADAACQAGYSRQYILYLAHASEIHTVYGPCQPCQCVVPAVARLRLSLGHTHVHARELPSPLFAMLHLAGPCPCMQFMLVKGAREVGGQRGAVARVGHAKWQESQVR